MAIRKQQNITNRQFPLYFATKMSDNESFESQTETEGSTDNEDIAEQSSVVQPYQFEDKQKADTVIFCKFGLLFFEPFPELFQRWH